jgi:hypothetical protein
MNTVLIVRPSTRRFAAAQDDRVGKLSNVVILSSAAGACRSTQPASASPRMGGPNKSGHDDY